jgi:hypothetical protein
MSAKIEPIIKQLHPQCLIAVSKLSASLRAAPRSAARPRALAQRVDGSTGA